MIPSGTSGMLSDSGSILLVHWSVCEPVCECVCGGGCCKGPRGLARSVCAHLAWLAYMWEVTGAGVMKAYLRPVDRTLRGAEGVESGSWFLAKAKHQVDNC